MVHEQAIFLAALERDNPAERAAYLQYACGDDVRLRKRVEALLRSHDQAGSFLGLPAAEQVVRNSEKSKAASAQTTRCMRAPQLPERRSLPFRRWAVAAAAVLLAVAGLGLTEATGVTKLSSTAIHLFTPNGTLVVEIDDPSVSVAIDGEEMVITGAGPKEIRLKAGNHKVEASKHGQPVMNELVNIQKAGRTIVRVRRDGPQERRGFEHDFDNTIRAGRVGVPAPEKDHPAAHGQRLAKLLAKDDTAQIVRYFASLPKSEHDDLMHGKVVKRKIEQLDGDNRRAFGNLAGQAKGEDAEVGFAVVELKPPPHGPGNRKPPKKDGDDDMPPPHGGPPHLNHDGPPPPRLVTWFVSSPESKLAWGILVGPPEHDLPDHVNHDIEEQLQNVLSGRTPNRPARPAADW